MKAPNLIAVAIVGVCLVLAFLAWSIFGRLADDTAIDGEFTLAGLQAELGLQKAEIEALRGQVAAVQAEIDRLKGTVEIMQADREQSASMQPGAGFEVFGEPEFEEGAVPATEALSEQMKLAKERFNKGIIQPKNAFMLEMLGPPRQDYSTACQGVSNPRLSATLETRQIGGFKLTMLRPALDSVEKIMLRLQTDEPEIFAALGTAGGLCVRFIRGSTTSISSHSWGAAVDLTLEGKLDAMGDGGTQFGLVILAEFFNDEGWYWGAGYGREDSMHFEIGEDLLRQWIAGGEL